MIPVITGMGMVSSLGNDVTESFAAFLRGGNAVHPLRGFDPARYRMTNAYEIADGQADVPGRASRWLRDAVTQALAQAGLTAPGARSQLREAVIPVIAGTGLAEQRSLELWRVAGAPVTLDQLDFTGTLAGLGMHPAVTIVNACSAGLYALAVAADLLELGEAEIVVAAASDAISESMFGLLDRVNKRPPSEVRPFDRDRVGVVLGEGSAAVVLEDPDLARRRGATPRAYLRAVATTCDAYHETAPLREGVRRAFRDAHRVADVSPGQIGLIMAHGTGTPLNDATEAAALHDVFGEDTGVPLVTALKSQIGHTSGASGLMSLVVAAEAMVSGQVPPTLNLGKPISEAQGFRFATGRPHHARAGISQIDAFGFGGVNAVAVLDRDAPAPARPRGGRESSGPPRRSRGSEPVAVTGAGLEVPGADGRGLLSLAGEGMSVAWRAGPPEFDGGPMLARRGLRYKDRATRLALSAVARALAAAGLAPLTAGSPESASFGVVVSSTFAITETVCRVVSTIHDGGVEAASPMDLPNVSGNVAASSIAIRFGLSGHNLTLSAGPASGIEAVYLAASAIRAGRARRMVVVGVEPASDPAASLIAASASRHQRWVPPPGMFDGATALVLEEPSAAQERDARVLALVEGHAHAASLGDCVSALAPGGSAAGPRVWFVPCQHHPGVTAEVARAAARMPPDAGQRPAQLDLSAVTGEASGAFGVLQCAAAAEWLAAHPSGRALVSSGGCWGASYAGLAMGGAT